MPDFWRETVARFLGESEDQHDFEVGSTIAQIFCGSMFSALAVYLVFSNSTRLSYVQRASIDKRLSVCCHINCIVAAISAFLNFFQLTKVDDWILPGNRQFTVDTSRPIEWILTCPLMQLSLVLMAGPRIPDYRRLLMPVLSVITLGFGTTTIFLDEPYIYICWGCGFCNHCVAMFFNRLQIIEHTKGTEGLFSGDSEFRKATLILMFTWIPFPAWFILSPEGLNIVSNIAAVQMGWAFLNIVSKFTLICYLQRSKDSQANRIKVKRAVQQTLGKYLSSAGSPGRRPSVLGSSMIGDLGGCVIETMQFLGMAENGDRLIKLLKKADITTLEQVSNLTKEECETLQLPYDLIVSIQKRTKTWAIEMVDEAEAGLENAEKYYNVGIGFPDSPQDTSNVLSAGVQSYDTRCGDQQLIHGLLGANRLPDLDGKSTDESVDMEVMKKMMDQLECNLVEKMGANFAAISDRFQIVTDRVTDVSEKVEKVARSVDVCTNSVDIGAQDVYKAIEKLQTRLEAKLECVFNPQSSTTERSNLEHICRTMQVDLDQIRQATTTSCPSLQSFEDEKMLLNNNVEKAIKETLAKVDGMQKMQESVLHGLKTALNEMADGMTHHIVQEWKATAFTLHSKIALVEEVQSRKSSETEERILQRIQQLTFESTDNVKGYVTREASNSVLAIEQMTHKIESLQTSRHSSVDSLERKIADMLKDSTRENSKQVELGLGMLTNTLRAQLDTMQAASVGLRKESDLALAAKLDSVLHYVKECVKRYVNSNDADRKNLPAYSKGLPSPTDGRWR